MFGNFNFADIGKHADELKSLVTGLLNSTQDTGEKASKALDTVLEAVGHLQTLMGIVSALQGQVSSLSKQVAALSPESNAVSAKESEVLEVTGTQDNPVA